MAEPVTVRLPAGAPRRAVLGTAYVMTARAHCVVEGAPSAPALTLWPRAGEDGAGLAAEALAVFEGQRARWALAEGGAGVRSELVR
ncbi:MAG: hypothetical protein KGL53_10820, partial [Elusimicrobia bacterium]|nr:hypothetical protein [Elusimicrobiota bacterium]